MSRAGSAGSPSLTDRLCTHCALCCDGSLFAEVELRTHAEADGLEILGLPVEDDGSCPGLLMLPCGALEGTRCSIYAYRPKTCRTFECALLQDVRRGAVEVEAAEAHIADALERIRRVKVLLAQLGQRVGRLPLKEAVADALGSGARASATVTGMRAELEVAMTGVQRLIDETFLGARPKAARKSSTPARPASS